jgi:hypothetical protein
MDKDEKNLETSLENWRKGVAPVEDVRSLAQDLGAYLYMPGIPVLLELLDNKDEMVRYDAAASLAMNFIYIPATGRMLAMLASDPDEDCRSMAASCLSSLCHDTKDRRVPHSFAFFADEWDSLQNLWQLSQTRTEMDGYPSPRD